MAGGLIGAAIAAVNTHAGALAEAAAPAPGAAEATAATGPAHPPRTAWAFFVRAWRPFCGWMIGLLLLRAVAVPIVQLIRSQPVEPTDWTALAAMAGILFITRSYERSQGIA
ncbi:MAG: hypothetical protein KGQ52_14515 [Alphaproteobacteria bacterium]|nr:hypothetical protein [Alphaproteobacteria bacterium]